jgi:predicted acylesterase/phospholipase RssA
VTVGDEGAGEAPAFERSAELLRDPVLVLRRAETALVRADLAVPAMLSAPEVRKLRYLLSFARLGTFSPASGGPDVHVGDQLASFRAQVVDELADPIRQVKQPRARLARARAGLRRLAGALLEARAAVIESGRCSPADLDHEVTNRLLCLVLGGGAGAGHVYLGALGLLVEQELQPAYVLGSSIGSLYGGMFARETPANVDEMRGFADNLHLGDVVGGPRRRRRHGMPGLFALRLRDSLGPMLRDPEGGPLLMRDTPIPFEAVVAGVRPSAFTRLPKRYRHTEIAALSGPANPARWRQGAALASRMWQLGMFFDARVVKPIVFGADELTAGLPVVDAIGFSCAVPGVLHYEAGDEQRAMLDELLRAKQVRALVDGGTASNVAVELAWRRVQDGRLRTRNAVYLALDCFHPQWDPRNLWLSPIAQAVQVQMVRNAPFADVIRRLSPTLSVLDLVPSPQRFTQAEAWGRASLAPDLPLLRRLLEPTPWS